MATTSDYTMATEAPVPVPAVGRGAPTADPAAGGVSRKRWTRAEFQRLGEQGWFDQTRVELIDGEIIQLPPPSEPHVFSVDVLRDLLRGVFARGYWVRSEAAVAPDDYSQPQPDIGVIEGERRLLPDHPPTVLLAVEVSNTTQRYDKTTKADLYARAGVADYWVLDVVDRELTVFREPREHAEGQFGWRYTQTTVLDESQSVRPLAKPDAELSVAAMLPPVEARP